MHRTLCSCYQGTLGTSTEYNISDWSRSTWKFSGFDVGATSGDFYHLLSSSTDNQCAILRENANGTQVWTRLYNTTHQCATLKVDANEAKAYFGNDGNVLALGVVNCSDGVLDAYVQMNDAALTVSQDNAGIAITPDSTKMILSGDSNSSSNFGYTCNCDTGTFS